MLELLDFLQGGEKPSALVSVLQKLVQIEGHNRQYHRMLAETYYRLKDFDKTCQEWLCIGELAIEHGSYYMQNGQADLSEQCFLESLEAYRALLMIEPFNLEVRQKTAELLHQLGKVQDAVEEYKLICNMTRAVQNYHDTLTALFHIVELAPDNETSAFLELGRICERQQKMELAVNFYKKYATRSLERADFGEVVQTCRRVLVLLPEDQEAQVWRDIALKVMKD